MRRTASPSRPSGRYAVGLRPSLDPDAYFGVPSQDKEARRTNQNTTEMGLDLPRSFRNDLRCGDAGRGRWGGGGLFNALAELLRTFCGLQICSTPNRSTDGSDKRRPPVRGRAVIAPNRASVRATSGARPTNRRHRIGRRRAPATATATSNCDPSDMLPGRMGYGSLAPRQQCHFRRRAK